MANKDKIIIDLYGGTGAFSEPYRKARYDVRVITLPDHDVLQTRIHGDTLVFYRDKDHVGREFAIPVHKVHGIIAAPPCTMFSRARTTGKEPRDFATAMEAVTAALQIIYHCRARGNLKWWVLENPMGYLRQFLGNPPHSFRGWEFGDDHVKFTDLWGYYRMPVGRFKKPVAFSKEKYAAPRAPAQYAHLKLSRADIRAITPAGFARAFKKLNP